MMYGPSCTLPGSILDAPEYDGQDLLDAFRQLKSGLPVRPPVDLPLSPRVPNLRWVYIRINAVKPPLHPKYQGPYKVISQTCNTVRIKVGDDIKLVNISRVKLFRGSRPPVLATRPCHGRPPKAIAGGTVEVA